MALFVFILSSCFSLVYMYSIISVQLVLGPSGVLQGIRPGKCYVEMSTVDPETITELSQVTNIIQVSLSGYERRKSVIKVHLNL